MRKFVEEHRLEGYPLPQQYHQPGSGHRRRRGPVIYPSSTTVLMKFDMEVTQELNLHLCAP